MSLFIALFLDPLWFRSAGVLHRDTDGRYFHRLSFDTIFLGFGYKATLAGVKGGWAFHFDRSWLRRDVLSSVLGISISIALFLLAVVCWVGSALGLPGLWVLVGISVLDAWLVPQDYLAHIPWWGVGILVGLALLGELVEFTAGALGVGKLGGSRRSAILSLVGSLAGAVVGFFIALPIPIPLIGPLVSSVLFSAVGALLGAWAGEHWKGSDTTKGLKVGVAAFWGRILGTIGKSIFGGIMVGLFAVLVFS